MPRVQYAIPSLDCRAWKGHSNPLLLSTLRFAPESRGSQRRRLIARKFSISSTRISATLLAPASKVYWENQVTHMVNQVDCVLSSLLLVDAPTFDPSILAHFE